VSTRIVELAFEFASHFLYSFRFESVEEQNTPKDLLVDILTIKYSQVLWKLVYKLFALLELQIIEPTVGLFKMIVYVFL
jgi:hypothetical protein